MMGVQKDSRQGNSTNKGYVTTQLSGLIFCLASIAIVVMIGPGLLHSAEAALGPLVGLPSVEDAVEDALPIIANDDIWFSLSEDEKISLLQTVVDYEAKRLQIPPPKLKAESLMGRTWLIGKCNPMLNQISYDKTMLANRTNWLEAINTCAHETYHEYQFFVSLGLLEDERGLRETWFYEGTHYISSSENREAYRSQSLEVTAREYAAIREVVYSREIEKLAA